MNHQRSFLVSFSLLTASSLFALGCIDSDDSTGASSGGTSARGGAENLAGGGSVNVAGAGGSSAGREATGGRQTTGGAPNVGAAGSGETSGGVAAEGGRAPASGGSPESEGGEMAGGETSASGGREPASSGGSESGGGAPSGGDATGGVAEGGEPGDPDQEVLCVDANGDPVPYDFSFGVASEYAFELSMSCDVGGYIAPLAAADPVNLTEVNTFILEMTDWYRSQVLRCDDSPSTLGPNDFGLLPISQSSDATNPDLEASTNLFMLVIDRHDNQPDAVEPARKEKIHGRLKSKAAKAVKNKSNELTKPLAPPDCVPAEGTSG